MTNEERARDWMFAPCPHPGRIEHKNECVVCVVAAFDEAEKRGMKKFAQLEIPLCHALDGVSWVRQAGEPPPNVTVYWRTGADTALAMLEAIRAAIKD